MVWLRSWRMERFIAGGREAANCGNTFLTLLTTSIVFDPGWRMMAMVMARWPLYQLPWRTLFTLSITWATSPRRTGAPMAIGSDDLVPESRRIFQLPMRLDDLGVGRAIGGAGRLVHAAVLYARGQRALFRCLARPAPPDRPVCPGSVLGGTEYIDLRHTAHLGKLARKQGVGIFVHDGQRQRLGTHRNQEQHRIVGGVDLPGRSAD